MPYDEQLADRIRTLFPTDVQHAERKMFGGLAFLVGGHMANLDCLSNTGLL